MELNIGATEYKSLDEVGSKNSPIEGGYHAVINEWDQTMREKSQVVVGFQILAGTTPKQEGKVQKLYIAMTTNKGKDNMSNFEAGIRRVLVAAGVISLNAPIQGDYTSVVVGRQVKLVIEKDEYEDERGQKKTSYRIADWGSAIYPLNDPAVVHIPTHPGALMLPGAQPFGAAVNSTPAVNNPVAGAAAAGAGGDWSKI